MRLLTLLLSLLLTPPLWAAWPYDACCNVTVPPYGGSGTLVGVQDGRGLVITCAHVLEGGDLGRITCRFPTATVRGRLLGQQRSADLAAIEVTAPAGIRSPVQVRAATRDDRDLLLVGCPWYGNGRLYWMRGDVAGFEGHDVLLRSAQLVQSGYSGGAVLTRRGELIGIIWGHSERHSMATSGQDLTHFVTRWLKQ